MSPSQPPRLPALQQSPSGFAARWLGRIAFNEALALQESLVEQRLAGEIDDTVLFLEHEPVYTIGRTRDRSSLREDSSLPFPVEEINRGGQATFHGPGQLVGYLICDLQHHGRDLHAWLRMIESVLIEYLQSFEIDAGRRENLTGVWVEDRKIASIGVGVRKWITMHGFALNVTRESLAGFEAIVPCGIENVEITALEKETGRNFDVEEVASGMQSLFENALAESAT